MSLIAPPSLIRLTRGARPAVAGVLAAFILAFVSSASGAAAQTPHVVADLVAETASAAPGRTLTVALHQVIAPGWHTYWRNPGDAGQPTMLSWALPPGWRAGSIAWPAPERFLAGPIMNYVYTREVYLPVILEPPADARVGQTVRLKANATWLTCKDVCIPEQAALTLDIPIQAGPAKPDPRGSAVALTVGRLPKPAGLAARFRLDGGALLLAVTGGALKGIAPDDGYFFPYDGTAIEQASAQHVARTAKGLTLTLPAGYGFSHGRPPAELAGVLSVAGEAFEITARPDAAHAAALAATPRSAPPAGARPDATSIKTLPPAALSPPASSGLSLLAALPLAFLGGLILNLMPCVFPVLSMKAAALARHLDAPARARGEGLAFLAGVVGSFLALAALLIAARAAGQAVGWGWQLQSPVVVGALVLVLFGAGLNLSGVFEAGLSLQGLGSEAAARTGGLAGAALTGVLAVVVAAPCTAPFMAPAIGWALTQPPIAALLVFFSLALGLAAPFVLVSFSPALFGRLPRPGAWMDGLRKVLAFPMYGAAAWFAWVFALQAGDAALPRLFAAVLALAFAAFCWGVGQRAGRTGLPRAAALAALLGAAAALAGVSTAPAVAAAASASAGSGPAAPQPWSAARVASLRAGGHPVFVDFTAAWCVTCQVNERTALAGRDVADAFARTGTVYLKADWTRPDPAITAALASQGRSGVPLYLVYGPKSPGPVILPQLLTGGVIVRALDAASRT